jgi:hypothetical protein
VSNSKHIDALVRLFVLKEKQERLLSLGAKASRWPDFRHALLHDTRNLNPRTLTRIVFNDTDLDALIRRLMVSSPTTEIAYCVSDNYAIDDKEIKVTDALRASVGREQDTMVFCMTRRLAFYENHEGEQYLLAAEGD